MTDGPAATWQVLPSTHDRTSRLEVPGGWLYQVGDALCFVPFPLRCEHCQAFGAWEGHHAPECPHAPPSRPFTKVDP